MNGGLQAVGLIEKDSHVGYMWLWIYPSIDSAVQETVQRNCRIIWDSDEDRDNAGVSTLHVHFKNQWIYLYTEASENITNVCIAVISSEYNPPLFVKLAQVLLRRYASTESPISLLETYLEVFTKGCCTLDDSKTLNLKSFDVSRFALTDSKFKDLISTFGVETILIFTAVLLKKKVVIYHPNYTQLATICRSVLLFASHRSLNWNALYPLVHFCDADLDELRLVAGGYVAGFIDNTIDSRSEMYDLFVNAYAREIKVVAHARETFAMGKVHKDLATFITQCADDETKSDQQCVMEIAAKTKELLNNLRSLGSEDDTGKVFVTAEKLRERRFPPATENFLLNLASVEGLLKM